MSKCLSWKSGMSGASAGASPGGTIFHMELVPWERIGHSLYDPCASPFSNDDIPSAYHPPKCVSLVLLKSVWFLSATILIHVIGEKILIRIIRIKLLNTNVKIE